MLLLRRLCEQPTQIVELGLRSNVGTRINGFTDVAGGDKLYDDLDTKACAGGVVLANRITTPKRASWVLYRSLKHASAFSA